MLQSVINSNKPAIRRTVQKILKLPNQGDVVANSFIPCPGPHMIRKHLFDILLVSLSWGETKHYILRKWSEVIRYQGSLSQ